MDSSLFLAVRHVAMGLSLCVALVHAAHAADACNSATTPLIQPLTASAATSADDYRVDAARHVYDAYAPCVLHGKLPPTIHAIALVELTVARDGTVRDVRFLRLPPEMPDAVDRLNGMIKNSAPFPAAPGASADDLRFNEVWMFDEEGRFQLGALTEGPP